jgi:hypothetical protein
MCIVLAMDFNRCIWFVVFFFVAFGKTTDFLKLSITVKRKWIGACYFRYLGFC